MKKFLNIVNVICCVCFAWTIGSVLYTKTVSKPIFIVCFLLTAVVIYLLVRWLNRIEYTAKKRKTVVSGLLAVYFVLLVLAGFFLIQIPGWDFNAVYHAANNLLSGGTLESQNEYMLMFSWNLFPAVYEWGFFSICDKIFHLNTLYYGILLNVISIWVSALLVYFCAKKLFSVQSAVTALVLFMLLSPVYFSVPIFYTHSFSMPYTILIFYLYLLVKNETGKRKTILFSALLGISFCIGYLCKSTVLFIILSVLFFLILSDKRYLKAMIAIASCCLTFFVYSSAVNASGIIDRTDQDQYERPLSHYVMMGLHGTGRYWYKDDEFTNSFDSKTEKDQADIEVINQRLSDYGFAGLMEHQQAKLIDTWNDGTFAISDALSVGLIRKQLKIYDCISTSGTQYGNYQMIADSYWIVLLLMMVCSLFRKNMERNEMVLSCSLIVLLIFLQIWETTPRYLFNYLPMIVLMSTYSVESVREKQSKNLI